MFDLGRSTCPSAGVVRSGGVGDGPSRIRARKVLSAATRWVHCPCHDRARMLPSRPAPSGACRRRSGTRHMRSRSPPAMEMEFKDSSRRRTLVLIVGVLLALVAGAGVFYLTARAAAAGNEPPALPTREIVVAASRPPCRADDRASSSSRRASCRRMPPTRPPFTDARTGRRPGRRASRSSPPARSPRTCWPAPRTAERISILGPDRDHLPDVAASGAP